VGIIIVIPWLIYMVLRYGESFWYVFLIYNNVARTAVPLEGHAGDVFFYLNYLVTRENLVWIVLLPFAGVLSLFNLFRKRNRADMLLVVWIVLVLGIFTFAQTKLYWYILPAFPAFAIMISSFLYILFNKLNLRRKNATLQNS
jgi:4-amino-4-deoxy-L-arabinose transferase-like glycosyltransferase